MDRFGAELWDELLKMSRTDERWPGGFFWEKLGSASAGLHRCLRQGRPPSRHHTSNKMSSLEAVIKGVIERDVMTPLQRACRQEELPGWNHAVKAQLNSGTDQTSALWALLVHLQVNPGVIAYSGSEPKRGSESKIPPYPGVTAP